MWYATALAKSETQMRRTKRHIQNAVVMLKTLLNLHSTIDIRYIPVIT